MVTFIPILAQFTSPIPVSPSMVSLVGYVTQALDALVAPTSNTFLGQATTLLNKLGLFALVMGALNWTWGYLTGHHIFTGEHFWRVLVRYLIAYNLLRYYNAPLPLVGYNFHQIFTEEGKWMAATIDIHVLDLFLAKIQQLWGGMEKPHIYDLPATFIYLWIGVDMALIEGALFIITIFSFWAIGIGIMLGPFFIVAYLFSATRHFFWAWVTYMIKYSMYRVVASAVVAIFANVILNFLSNTLHGDYSLGHWWAIALSFTVVVASGFFACFKVSHIVNDLTTGSAHGGASGGLSSLLQRIF
jgi:TrbL/VirB6 plasmid conjugal transfer protein